MKRFFSLAAAGIFTLAASAQVSQALVNKTSSEIITNTPFLSPFSFADIEHHGNIMTVNLKADYSSEEFKNITPSADEMSARTQQNLADKGIANSQDLMDNINFGIDATNCNALVYTGSKVGVIASVAQALNDSYSSTNPQVEIRYTNTANGRLMTTYQIPSAILEATRKSLAQNGFFDTVEILSVLIGMEYGTEAASLSTPMRVDELTVLKGAELKDNTLIYKYEIDSSVAEFLTPESMNEFAEGMKESVSLINPFRAKYEQDPRGTKEKCAPFDLKIAYYYYLPATTVPVAEIIYDLPGLDRYETVVRENPSHVAYQNQQQQPSAAQAGSKIKSLKNAVAQENPSWKAAREVAAEANGKVNHNNGAATLYFNSEENVVFMDVTLNQEEYEKKKGSMDTYINATADYMDNNINPQFQSENEGKGILVGFRIFAPDGSLIHRHVCNN